MIKKTISDIDKNNCSPSQQTELQSQLLARMDKVSSAIREADDLEQMTSDVLDSLLSIFDCDRAWLIFPCDPDAESWQPKMERTKPEYPGGSANKSSQSMAPDTAGTMQILLDSAEPVCFGAGSKYDIAETARQYGVKSSISMALYPKIGKPWMFGLHQCSYPRTWTKEEKDLFSEIGRRLTESLTNILVLLDVRESEERFRQVFNLPCIGMVVFSLDGYLLSANRTFCHMLGHAEEALWKMTHQQLAHPDDLNPDNNKTQQLIDGELPYWQLELRYRHVDGHYKWVRLTSNVIRSAAGEPLYLVAQIDDIDQSKRDEEEIALLNFAINRINETVYLVDKDSRFKYVNDKACQTLGYSRNELLKMHIYDISPLFPKNRWREVWSDLKKRGSVTVETEHRTKDGDIIPVEVNANYFEFDNQSYDLALARDISEQQHNEEILRRSKADLEIALESGNLGYWKWDLSTNNINWSARCNEIYGLSPEVKPTYDLADRMTHPDDRERVRSEFNKAIKDGETFVTEKRIIVPPDGTERWTLTRGKVTFNDSHQPEFVAGIIADITERKLAEGIQRKTALALKESEERFRQMAENIQEVFWLIDMSNREILYASPAHEKLWGKSHRFIDELFESIHPEDKSLVEKLIYSPPTDNATIEYRIIHQDNSVKHIQVSAFPIYDVNGNIYRGGCYARDYQPQRAGRTYPIPCLS
jgi:PAS domain S-box-containing protein